jgi:hypothetical protein
VEKSLHLEPVQSCSLGCGSEKEKEAVTFSRNPLAKNQVENGDYKGALCR